eukprot:CAMPEP_0176421644 /NCGR_PEP_ID=MMETSP0127-20121128/9294_1 /TAXON_ID=938130 /ORGANISM="Platyophrya macrostoma, Strain WH" /LENGTH=298 /DNA_ID=CAMNT_0017802409 /DNA_START=48 /DNA_END=944 /DNA_ORIENTATION=-
MDYKEEKKKSSFINLLYSNIENGDPKTLSWSKNGNEFIIWDRLQFAHTILPHLCSHSNFSSFTRQLNMYNFKKIKLKNNTNAVCYSHPCFIKGQPLLTLNVKRKNPRLQARLKKQKKLTNTNSKLQQEDNIFLKKSTIVTVDYSQEDYLTERSISAKEERKHPIQESEIEKKMLSLIKEYLKDDEDDEVIENENSVLISDSSQRSGLALDHGTEFSNEEFGEEFWSERSSKRLKQDVSNNPTNSVILMNIIPRNKLKPVIQQPFRFDDYIKCQNLIANLNKISGEMETKCDKRSRISP